MTIADKDQAAAPVKSLHFRDPLTGGFAVIEQGDGTHKSLNADRGDLDILAGAVSQPFGDENYVTEEALIEWALSDGGAPDEGMEDFELRRGKQVAIKSLTYSGHPLMGRMEYQGLPISIENEAGSWREGTDPDGNPWKSLLKQSYGYIRGTVGHDGDHVDCFIGIYKDSPKVFIVHQQKIGKPGHFDEDKIMLGWLTKTEAMKDYFSNYDRKDQFWSISEMAMDEFKKKIFDPKYRGRMMKAVIHTHSRRSKTGKVSQVKEHEDSRTKSDAFKTWFGHSKVVDAKGAPLVVYHGTSKEFSTFDRKRSIGGQYWFTTSRKAIEDGEIGAQGKGVILEVYLSLQNPAGWDEYDKFGIGELIGRGYDGLALPSGDETTYVAFHPHQIKSAKKNSGAFDPKNPNMKKALVRAHARRSKTGKVTQVKQHTDKRTKKKVLTAAGRMGLTTQPWEIFKVGRVDKTALEEGWADQPYCAACGRPIKKVYTLINGRGSKVELGQECAKNANLGVSFVEAEQHYKAVQEMAANNKKKADQEKRERAEIVQRAQRWKSSNRALWKFTQAAAKADPKNGFINNVMSMLETRGGITEPMFKKLEGMKAAGLEGVHAQRKTDVKWTTRRAGMEALSGISPGRFDEGIISSFGEQFIHGEYSRTPSPKQSELIDRLVYKYRKQILEQAEDYARDPLNSVTEEAAFIASRVYDLKRLKKEAPPKNTLHAAAKAEAKKLHSAATRKFKAAMAAYKKRGYGLKVKKLKAGQIIESADTGKKYVVREVKYYREEPFRVEAAPVGQQYGGVIDLYEDKWGTYKLSKAMVVFVKSHVKEHERRLESGKLVHVRAHEDGRTVYWHGSASGDLRGGATGLHIGTKEAAKQALEARIGVPADGKGWNGDREYGKTLLAGKATLRKIKDYYISGFNCDAPEEDYYPKKVLKYADGSDMPMNVKPNISAFKIRGKMTNTPRTPHPDFKANGYMAAQKKKGNAKSGYFYTNDGEDAGSISATVPNGDHLDPVIKSKFESWFGDSKVVDEKGAPLVVYHGTSTEFDAFNLDHAGSNNDTGMWGTGFYFSSSRKMSSGYGGNIKRVYLSLQNPLIIKGNMSKIPKEFRPARETHGKKGVAESLALRNRLLKAGYDGVIQYEVSNNAVGHEKLPKQVIAFHPNQIKSATGNQGTFDPSNPDITKSVVKQHTRRSKTGKVSTVKEHTDTRRGKSEKDRFIYWVRNHKDAMAERKKLWAAKDKKGLAAWEVKWKADMAKWQPSEKAVAERVRAAWDQAHDQVPIHGTPSSSYPQKIYQTIKTFMNAEFKHEAGGKDIFTQAQLMRAVFHKNSTHHDAWEYLEGLVMKKVRKAGKPLLVVEPSQDYRNGTHAEIHVKVGDIQISHTRTPISNGRKMEYFRENGDGTLTETDGYQPDTKEAHRVFSAWMNNNNVVLKSHVKQHERRSANGKVSVVHDYDDKRSKKEAPEPEQKPGMVYSEAGWLPRDLQLKTRRGMAGEGVEIKLTEEEVDTLLKHSRVGIVSAGRNPAHPKDKTLSDDAIKRRTNSLRADLVKGGFKFVRVKGHYEGEEESFMVMIPNISERELTGLGTKYRQDSVIFTEGGKNKLIYTYGENKGKHHPGNGFEYKPKAKDYYTEIETNKGIKKFSLNLDFSKLVKALIFRLFRKDKS